jgi:hypothetical protein
VNPNDIITFCLLIGLLLITLSFVWNKRKALIMLRALFSARYFQQLLREGKTAYEQIFFYAILIHLVTFPSLILAFFHFYFPEVFQTFSHLIRLYGILFGGMVVATLLSQFFLWYFTAIFNYQEQRYLYTTIKALYRFYNALFLVCLIPIVWFAPIPELIFFAYIPLFLTVFLTFLIRFLRNVNGISRIHFFIYFCSLEILPYLLLIKLFAIIYN